MKNNLVKSLIEDKINLEKKIRLRETSTIKDFSLKLLVKSGIALDYALPYILATILALNISGFKQNLPFVKDDVKEYAQLETIDTSSGIHIKKTNYDDTYSNEFLEYSTGWKINEDGLYEREITSYKLSDEIDLTDTNKILSMSKEEIENILEIKDIKKIKVSFLGPEDYMYNSDSLIVVNNSKSEEEFIYRNETAGENILNSIYYIIVTIGWRFILMDIKRIIFKNRFKDNLGYYKETLNPINTEDLEKFKEVLKLKEENLKMLDENSKSLTDKNYIIKRRCTK